MAPLIQHEEQRVLPAGATGGDEISSAGSQHTAQLSVHPIPELQGPFDESISEAVGGTGSKRVVNIDAQTRRRNLLESAEYERLCGRKWPQRAGGRYHPIWKLTSQMLFGVHLLVRGLAKSDTEVLRILQIHVDEVDGFLGRTTEDFLIVEVDVYTRMQYLSLPLQNLNTFDEMLEDRLFRLSMLDYNDKIEHAIQRFTASIDDSLKDIQKGKAAIRALWKYLYQAEKEYELSGYMAALVSAMLSNAEGWNVAFSDLRRKGLKLQAALAKLSLAITEMQRRIGVASRKKLVHQQTERGSMPMPRLTSRRSFSGRFFERPKTAIEKPLPCDPIPSRSANGTPQPIESRDRQRHGSGSRADKEPARRSSMSASQPTKHTDKATHHVKSHSFIPGMQRSIVKRLSKAKLSPMTCADDEVDHPPKRPTTAPSPRRLKARTISMEQLKSFRYPRKEPHSNPMTPPMPTQHERQPTASQTHTRQETMKDQLLHYLKSDRVADAWEHTVRKEKKGITRRVSQIKLNGPLSAFRTRPSTALGSPGKPQTTYLADGSKIHTSSLQNGLEAFDTTTYPLKPKRDDSAPRIHVLSLQMTLAQESERKENGHRRNNSNNTEITWDAQSVITALPSVPPTIPEGPPKSRTLSGWRH
ncbi:hypothetical protein P168DRAFT_319456 [Aspergillus campestris IBT 28561]|uniref:Uncharacterized protein n=1 Tax=Aspergillus campestris (strain IBT 28561) TaxID=1392248 RepID=A0A2I1CZ58_ASPC2|nr:uncharacterized protein P168DRAFT_319456 [Aspergillus campestris IBT 28561]PKY02913.1 hypothetical protein P168DRAFT_319456 [Aspergillus campestris IBT 28561]